MLVYVILNTANGKKYVGQTQRSLKTRWAEHRYNACCPSSATYDGHFYRAIRKYGADAFEPITLREVSTKEELDKEERRFIALYHSDKPYAGYNGTLGGEGGIPNEETRQKISAAIKGRKLSEEHKAAIGAANLGKVVSDETRKRISEAHREISDAEKKALSERNLVRWANPAYRQRMSDALRGKNTGPRPESVGQKISATAKSKLRGKETELKLLRCLGGLSYEQIAKIYGVSKKSVHKVCKDFGSPGKKRKSYGAPTLTTKAELLSLGLITDTPHPAPVAASQLSEKDQTTCNQEL